MTTAPGNFKILRRHTGATGSPALGSGILFFNEVDNCFYFGFGDDGSGNSTAQVKIGGIGAFVDLITAQTITAAKTFSVSPLVPTPATNDNSQNAASTAFVTAAIAAIAASYAPKNNPTLTGTVTIPTPAAGDNSNAAATTSFIQTALSAFANGLQFKMTARLATAVALPANAYSNGVLTASANGALSVDSVAVATNDLVLVKNEATAANNGLYIVTNPGASGAPYVLTRYSDMNATGQFNGAFVPVSSAGATQANSLWLCNPGGPVTVGTTAVPFTQLNGATDLLQGLGVLISGNTISLAGLVSVVSGSLLKWNGSAFVAAVAGTDYVAPNTTFDAGTA